MFQGRNRDFSGLSAYRDEQMHANHSKCFANLFYCAGLQKLIFFFFEPFVISKNNKKNINCLFSLKLCKIDLNVVAFQITGGDKPDGSKRKTRSQGLTARISFSISMPYLYLLCYELLFEI